MGDRAQSKSINVPVTDLKLKDSSVCEASWYTSDYLITMGDKHQNESLLYQELDRTLIYIVTHTGSAIVLVTNILSDMSKTNP